MSAIKTLPEIYAAAKNWDANSVGALFNTR